MTGEAFDASYAALKHAPLFVGCEIGRTLVHVSVVADLVATVDNLGASVGKAVDGMAGYEECRRNAFSLEKLENPREPHARPELATRQR